MVSTFFTAIMRCKSARAGGIDKTYQLNSDADMQWIKTEGDAQATGAIEVNVPSMDRLIADLERRANAGEGFCLATLNLDHVVKLQASSEFRSAYQAHSHVTADGRPIVWLSRLSGQTVDLVPGSDLVLPIIDMAQRTGLPVAFFGATETALRAAAERLQAQYPHLKIAAKIAPPMGFDPKSQEADGFIDALQHSGARIVFLALGAPKQEIFAQRAFLRAPHMGFASVGAGIDFIAGTQKRAPAIVRKGAAEWLWRLASDPRRLFARYMACFAILPSLTVRALQGRRSKNGRVEAG